MRTRLLTLTCERTPDRKLRCFLVQQADITGTSGVYGGSSKIRISKQYAAKLLGYSATMDYDFPGKAFDLASITIVIP